MTPLLLIFLAPLPFPKVSPPAPPPAVYVLSWHGTAYDVTLHASGRYEASSGTSRWAGRWKTGPGGTLVVSECVAEQEAERLKAGRWPLVWSPSPWPLDGTPPAVHLERVK